MKQAMSDNGLYARVWKYLATVACIVAVSVSVWAIYTADRDTARKYTAPLEVCVRNGGSYVSGNCIQRCKP